MLVGALGVVADHDLRAVPLDQRADAAGHLVQPDVAEGLRPVLVVPVGHARVVVSQHLQVADPEYLGRLAQLGQPQLGHRLRVVTVLAGLHAAGSIPELTVRAGHHDRADPLAGVCGEHAAGARGFVVRVSVHGHQRQFICHRTSLPDAAGPRETGLAGPGCEDVRGRSPCRSRRTPAQTWPPRRSAPWPGWPRLSASSAASWRRRVTPAPMTSTILRAPRSPSSGSMWPRWRTRPARTWPRSRRPLPGWRTAATASARSVVRGSAQSGLPSVPRPGPAWAAFGLGKLRGWVENRCSRDWNRCSHWSVSPSSMWAAS